MKASAWIEKMFDAQIVGDEGVIRRNKADVEKYASFDELLEVTKEYGYHLIETGEQYIVICNQGHLKLWC